jgi:hypothetical protein
MSSYANNQFDKVSVIQACEQALSWIILQRLEYRKAAIQSFKTYRKYWLFGAVMERSDDEAFSLSKNDLSSASNAYMAERAGSSEEEIIRGVCTVASLTESQFVNLTRLEISTIKNWYPVGGHIVACN